MTRITVAQKLPTVPPPRPAIPRTSAAATAMLTDAALNVWNARPTIWEKYESVDSPP